MGTHLFVNVKRGRSFARAEIETLNDDELHDLLQRASPTQLRAFLMLIVQWIRAQQQSENARALEERPKAKAKK